MVFNKKERADHATVGGGYFVGYDKNGEAFSMRRIPEEYENEYAKLIAFHHVDEGRIAQTTRDNMVEDEGRQASAHA